jgi:hypothetical protein
MKKYQVRKCDEQGHDYEVKTCDSWLEARDYEEHLDKYDNGWHHYTKTLTYYRVWLNNEYCESFPLFDSIEKDELEAWLRENAEPSADFGKTVWWIDHNHTASIRDDIPYNSMGYIVKFEEI